MYVTDMKNYKVQVFDSKDSFVRQWGSMATGADQFSETVPGIAIVTNDHVYIVDKINSRVQMFDSTETIYLVGDRMEKVPNCCTNQKILL
jgi:tripartite motif-containing protein 71